MKTVFQVMRPVLTDEEYKKFMRDFWDCGDGIHPVVLNTSALDIAMHLGGYYKEVFEDIDNYVYWLNVADRLSRHEELKGISND